MVVFFIFILIFLVANGFLFLEEEVLILFAAIFWVDCAGGFIRESLWSELEHRRFVIRDKFKWYLETKINLLETLIKKHQGCEKIVENLGIFYEGYVNELVNEIPKNVNKVYTIVSRHKINEDLNKLGLYVTYINMVEAWTNVLTYHLYKKMIKGDNTVKKEWLGEK